MPSLVELLSSLYIWYAESAFSNEAGQGSSAIAHSAAKTDEPVREGVVAGLEPLLIPLLSAR